MTGPNPMRICAVTTTRADYGIFLPVLRLLEAADDFDLVLAVGGSHNEAQFGATGDLLALDGFRIGARVDSYSGDQDGVQAASATANAIAGFSAAFDAEQPDLILVLGDRYEMLGAAIAAHLLRIPLGHIAGGDVTVGALDDGFRHAITKLSTIHFVTARAAQRRVIAMGEDPSTVFLTGSPAIDHLSHTEWLADEQLASAIPRLPADPFALVTLHPETMSVTPPATQAAHLLSALDELGPKLGVVVTGPNGDPGASEIRLAVTGWCENRPNTVFVENLGTELYLNVAMRSVAVVGNSSSGLYEAPALGVWTIDIGDRQLGRERADTVKSVPFDQAEIAAALRAALVEGPPAPQSPYGDGHAAEKIVHALRGADLDQLRAPKMFFEAGAN